MFRAVSLAAIVAVAANAAAPLQTFTLREPLGRAWTDELVHFGFEVPTALLRAERFHLTDAAGHPLPCQITDLARPRFGRVRGQAWTVVSLAPDDEQTLQLRRGQAAPAEAALRLDERDGILILANDRLALQLPRWPGELPPGAPLALARLPPPLRAVAARADGPWLGELAWMDASPTPLTVARAVTEIVERGPVLVIVRQRLQLTDGRTYAATVRLGLRQDAALVSEESDIAAPAAALRFSLLPGLQPDRVYWHNQWKKTDLAESYALTTTPLSFAAPATLCRLRPWSFWWLGDLTPWAAFYREGAEPYVGVLALRPSRWRPDGWAGFDRTEVPLQVGPGPRCDLTFGLLAQETAGQDRVPLRREWAVTVGRVADLRPERGPEPLRRLLTRCSEFPLDEVKDYGFERVRTPQRTSPFLFFSDADIQRVRRQAATDAGVRQRVEEACTYIRGCGEERVLAAEGWEAYYRKNYIGNYQVEKLPEAWLGTGNPLYQRLLAAAVKGLRRELLDTFLDAPTRPALGAYGPWFTEAVMRLLRNYELVAGQGGLTPAEDTAVRRTLVFAAHVLAHPDYWNTDVGLCSANPNMTSSIRLPLGLLALYLDGHPCADAWLAAAEDELQRELRDWVSPGGAWIEDPGYQAASLDGMFLLAQGLRNVRGRDYFAHPQFQATLEYYGFLLTPPDPRFPPGRPDAPHPMTLPSIGDMFSGFCTGFNGWMAAATAATAPDYSARQQFFWQSQNRYIGMAGRAQGLMLAFTDPALPAAPPRDLARGFPGFGAVLRTSWTDPRASYVAHRTGPHSHHYHDEYNAIVFHAKGAPLCLDFGNCYQPLHRREAWYHNRVSFGTATDNPGTGSGGGELLDFATLPGTLDLSAGRVHGSDGQQNTRHVLLVKSPDPLGANYVVLRDHAAGGPKARRFHWNLFCLAGEAQISGAVAHFPGAFGVDLDVHFLSPVAPRIEKDFWEWTQHIYVWGPFQEAQHGIRVAKSAADPDFLALLYPRAAGQPAAEVVSLAEGQALRLRHMEGIDLLAVSPGVPATAAADGLRVAGEIALARRYTDGRLRLAVLRGTDACAAAADWELRGAAPTAVEVAADGASLAGESNGAAAAHTVTLTVPPAWRQAVLTVNGTRAEAAWRDTTVELRLPAGYARFTLTRP